MPGGVQSRFLDVLQADEGLARRRIAIWSVLAVALGALAWPLWPPLGPLAHLSLILLGMGLGVLASRRRTQDYEDSMRGAWSQWMRFALACETTHEIHQRVQGRSSRNAAVTGSVLLALLWVAEVGLLAFGLREDPDPLYALPAIVLNGLLAGTLLGHAIHRTRWFHGARSSVTELVESGEIGVWGVL